MNESPDQLPPLLNLIKLFSVVKHFRNGSEPMFIQENLTLKQAKKIVNSFPDSQETMVTMVQQEKQR